MTRAYSVYLSMFVLLALGLWAILHLGRGLRAPVDVSGDWRVAWTSAAPPGLARDGALRIEQSGRYLVLDFGDELRLPVHVDGGWMTAATAASRTAPARLRADGATGTLFPADGALVLELNTDSVYQARLSRDASSPTGAR